MSLVLVSRPGGGSHNSFSMLLAYDLYPRRPSWFTIFNILLIVLLVNLNRLHTPLLITFSILYLLVFSAKYPLSAATTLVAFTFSFPYYVANEPTTYLNIFPFNDSLNWLGGFLFSLRYRITRKLQKEGLIHITGVGFTLKMFLPVFFATLHLLL